MNSQHSSGASAPQEGFISVAGAKLHYRAIGQGLPIILVHGGPGFDHHYLRPDMDRLAASFRLIYYDQRGRGQSAWIAEPTPVSLQSELDDLETLRAEMHLDQTALLGHSWGGLLALEYALRHPERVSQVILLNTCPVSYEDFHLFKEQLSARDPEDAERMRILESRPAFADGDPETRAAYYRLYFQPTLRPSGLLDRLIAHLQVGWTKESVLIARVTTRNLFPDTVELPEYNLLPQLTGLRIPTIVLHGDYDFVPVASASHIAEAIPGARFVVLSDCGHFSYIEQPEEVCAVVCEFIEAH